MNRLALRLGLAAGAASAVLCAPAVRAQVAPRLERAPQAAPPYAPRAPAQIIGQALSDGQAYAWLEELTDTVGPRMSGSPGAEAAVQWAASRLREAGFTVRLEKVRVNHWVRGEEHARVLPEAGRVGHPLFVTALGNSVGTDAGPITAPIIEVHSVEELEALGPAVRGKIVFFNHTMGQPGGKGGYGSFVGLRIDGPRAAGKLGAVAILLRSLATTSLRSPHTGVTVYGPAGNADGPRIPGAAIATEDADLLHRLLGRGPVRVELQLGCKMLPEVESANVVADLRGREKPDEVVLMGAHLDSWDLATGATDDGAGVAIVMEALHAISSWKPAPRRTVRVVLFMNEENGVAGGRAYAAQHANELGNHVAALEADSGSGRAQAMQIRAGSADGDGGSAGPVATLRPWLVPLQGLGLDTLTAGGEGGTDISPIAEKNVPIFSIQQDGSRYFETHHSAADTLDKVSPADLAQNAAAAAWYAYALAEMPARLPPATEPLAPRRTGIPPPEPRRAH